MKRKLLLVCAAGLLVALTRAQAATLYVDAASTNAVPPFTNWTTAAANIQDAVDAAASGDEIVVTNGVYQTGALAVYGMNNRLSVTKAVTVRSVNGPELTIIRGAGPVGGTAIRCVYLTNGAVLSGFTLTDGATQHFGDGVKNQSGGGVLCESASAVVSNCTLSGNSAYAYGGGASGGTLNHCTLTGNSATYNGGGAYSATLNDCLLTGNSAVESSGGGAVASTLYNSTLTNNQALFGGGAHSSTLTSCTVARNSAWEGGGGVLNSMLFNCTLTGNRASDYGGGAYDSTLFNCTLTGNSGADSGGAHDSTLFNCVLAGNWAGYRGGGAVGSTLNNCTVNENSAEEGGGVSDSALNNCIVYFNTAHGSGDNYIRSTLNYSCTTPLPISGTGNISDEPQLAGNWHLSVTSPCRGAGSAASTSGMDLDGDPWANPPSIGCDEYWSGSLTGALSVAFVATYIYATPAFAVDFQAVIDGRVSASRWDFGDGTVVSNRLDASHAWVAPGDYVVELRAYNETYPTGVATSVVVRVVEGVHYVSVTSTNPVPPYTNWTTAATRIQDAVDVTVPGSRILVSDGVYQAGATAVYGTSNRVAMTRPVTVQSVNGPAFTSIVGYQEPGITNGPSAIRCVYLTNGAVLAGFTLTNGATQGSGDWVRNQSGGGVWCESSDAVVSNCTLTGNAAFSYGGGAFGGTLYDCSLTGNSASDGGGVNSGTLNHCVLAGNSARFRAGGAGGSTLNDCALTGNSAASTAVGLPGAR